MKRSLFAGTALAALTAAVVYAQAPPPGEEDIPAAIRAVLDEQLGHWNEGDLEGFLQGYWKSPDLTFSSGGTMRRGFDETRARYLEAYPTRERMGATKFSELEVTPLGDSAAFALGRWRLETSTGETMGGNFTLIFRRIDGQWRIVHDHTSRSPAPEDE